MCCTASRSSKYSESTLVRVTHTKKKKKTRGRMMGRIKFLLYKAWIPFKNTRLASATLNPVAFGQQPNQMLAFPPETTARNTVAEFVTYLKLKPNSQKLSNVFY